MEARESNCLDAGQVRNARGAISNSRDEVLSSDESLPHSSAASVIDGAAEAASISAQKDELIALVSVSSVMEAGWSFKKGEHSVLFGDPRDLRRMAELVHSVSADDGEFVLKLALYARRDLCLHRTAALLVSFCAYEWRCQPFLKCYMKHIVLLPSDWLSVANVALQVSHFQLPPSRSVVASVSSATGEEAEFKREKCDGGFKSLPNALQLALASIFTTFDEFSLSEYNTERCVKRARRKQGRHTRSTSPTGAELNRQGYANGPFSSHPRERTFKDLVRHLHISEPIYVVYCLLGRRYPSNREIFLRRKMDDGGRRDFDPSLSGKRMRLPVPETWERAISRDGNRGAVWDGLVASNRLPLTAALCNVRNVILSGSSRETHASLVNRFTSEEDIFASQQLPGRFVAAHDRLCISARSALSRFYALVDRDRTLSTSKSSDSNNSCSTPPSVTEVEDLCCKYKSALQRAAELSIRLNITPMSGCAFLIVSITREMMLEEGFEGRKLIDDACLLALEFKYAFESCTILFLVMVTATWLMHMSLVEIKCGTTWNGCVQFAATCGMHGVRGMRSTSRLVLTVHGFRTLFLTSLSKTEQSSRLLLLWTMNTAAMPGKIVCLRLGICPSIWSVSVVCVTKTFCLSPLRHLVGLTVALMFVNDINTQRTFSSVAFQRRSYVLWRKQLQVVPGVTLNK
ncbi:TROVE domain [Trypanosoma vivax]|nr:TROVE domain [Trypanosoma vivax]